MGRLTLLWYLLICAALAAVPALAAPQPRGNAAESRAAPEERPAAQPNARGQAATTPTRGEGRRQGYAGCNRESHKRNLHGGARRRFLIRCKLGLERRQPARGGGSRRSPGGGREPGAIRAVLRLVVFDVDGTLVDSQHLIVEAQARAFAEHGLTAPGRKDALSVVGLSLAEAFRRLVGEAGPIAALSDSYRRAFQALRRDPAYEEPLFPGMAALVARLHATADLQLGIATGKSRRGVDHVLTQNGWEGWFATIQTADDAPSKPDPTMLRQAMGEAGVAPSETVMIGDTTYDMAMARGAGAGAIGVAWGYHPPGVLVEAGAVTVCETAEALADWLAAPRDAAAP